MASVADTAAPWADSDDPVSPELALVDPDLARRLRSRETARPAPPVRPPGAPSILPVLAFQHELRLTAEPPPDPDAVRASFHAPPRPAPETAAPLVRATIRNERPRIEASEGAPRAVRRPFRVSALGALALVAVTLVIVLAVAAKAVFALGLMGERTDGTARTPVTPASTAPASTAPASPAPVGAPPAAATTAPEPLAPASQLGSPTSASAAHAPDGLQPHLVVAPPEARRPPGGAAAATRLAPVTLSWPGVEGSTAYRFELFRGAARLFATLTPTPSFAVPLEWTSAGRPGRLERGLYRWRVWALDAAGRADDAPLIESQLRVG